MDWIHKYQLFLFDFDGLLVNTEEIHFQAYVRMCAQRGFLLDWSLERFFEAAHHEADGLRKHIYAHLPTLFAQEPDWNILYAEKKQHFLALLAEGAVQLMPGVADLLHALDTAQIKRCVVTHSETRLVNAIRRQNPLLDTIPMWLTREDYTHPKPHPECYLQAIKKWAKADEAVIGFEDSPRGLKALMGTHAQPVLIGSTPYPQIPDFLALGVRHYASFKDLNHPWTA